MKKALITGITGQDGSFLAELLLSKNYEVYGLTRRSSTVNNERIAHIEDKIHLLQGDLLDQSSLTSAIADSQPDEVYNLAAQSFVKTSWNQPVLTGEFTALGVTRMLEAIRSVNPKIKFYQASSSEMFGKVTETPQKETTRFYPRSPYGVAKCVTGRTKIYTDKGLVSASRIQVGDKVWTHTGQLRKVMEVYARLCDGEFINIKVSSSQGMHSDAIQSNIQLTLTPEHPVLTENGWIQAKDLQDGQKVAIVCARCKNCNEKIPVNRKFCSLECSTSYRENQPDRHEELIWKGKDRFAQQNPFQTIAAIKNRNIKIANRLKLKGKNSQEFYLDLLVQNAAPGFFQFTGDGKEEILGCFPDWLNVEKKAIIEYFGWGTGLDRRQEQISRKFTKYTQAGYKTLFLYTNDFDNPEQTKEKVAAFCSSLGSVEFIYYPIKKVSIYKTKPQKVFNFEVEESHSYVANAIAVHNCYGHYITVNYRESFHIFACSGILFNHESSRRGLEFVTRKISNAVARISLDKQDKVELGNLDSERDWGFAGDYVEAMWLMLQQDKPDDYVIATGEKHSVKEFVQLAFSVVGIDDWQNHVSANVKDNMRPAEVDFLIGDFSKAKKTLGWTPKTSFAELVKMMVEADIAREKKEK